MVTRGVDRHPEAGGTGDVHVRGHADRGQGVGGRGQEAVGLGHGIGGQDHEEGTQDPGIKDQHHVAGGQEVIGQDLTQDPGLDQLNHFQGKSYDVN